MLKKDKAQKKDILKSHVTKNGEEGRWCCLVGEGMKKGLCIGKWGLEGVAKGTRFE